MTSDLNKKASIIFVLSMVISTMHPIHGLLNVDVKYIFVLSLALLILLSISSNVQNLNDYEKAIIVFIFTSALFGTLISGSTHQMLIGLVGVASVFGNAKNYKLLNSLFSIQILIVLNIIILIGAWFSFVYAFIGSSPMFYSVNLETSAKLPFYLSSFTNAVHGNIIRPAGLFDEPGALAMFTILVACLVELKNKNNRVNIYLLSLNMITFSLVAVLALALYFLFRLSSDSVTSSFKRYFFVFVCAGFLFFYFGNVIDELILSRFVLVDGVFAGDNRSNQISNFFENINFDIFFSGHKVISDSGPEFDMSSNPLTLLYASGIFIWLPYFFLSVYLAFNAIFGLKQVKYPSLLLLVVILQRPYIFSMYWSLLIGMVFISILRHRDIANTFNGSNHERLT